MKEEELIRALKEMNKKRVEELEPNSRKLFDAIMELADSRDKYKSLYENEKDHTDTLKRIIKKIEENLQELYIANDDKSYDLYKNILNLLKEIK